MLNVTIKTPQQIDEMIVDVVDKPIVIPPPSVPAVCETLGHGDAAIMDYIPTAIGNYDLVKLCRSNNGQTSFNARSQPFEFTDDDIAFIKAIQPDDESIYGAKIEQKWNWHGFGGASGRPYFKSDGIWKRDLMVYGHSLVAVGASEKFHTDFPTGKSGIFDFYKLKGFKRHMKPAYLGEYVDYVYRWNYNGSIRNAPTRVRSEVIPLIEAGILQVCTENQAGGSKISITSKGLKFDIVPDPDEYSHPQGTVWLWEGALK